MPLNGEINKYVNFARMAEERYGFNALHPRLAAQRERLARVAAAGALLERVSNGNGGGQSGSGGASADEMSLELSDGEDGGGDTSNVEMGGMGQSETGTGTNGDHKKPARKRRMKEDQYDKEDPFVDDSELAWEEQAAASKDGFFVYSGPLVPEGEKPQVERYVRIIFHPSPSLPLPIDHSPPPPSGRALPRSLRPPPRGPCAPRATPPQNPPEVVAEAEDQPEAHLHAVPAAEAGAAPLRVPARRVRGEVARRASRGSPRPPGPSWRRRRRTERRWRCLPRNQVGIRG